MENQELVHWGIKGMRWGVRRYQNKDGSLTPAGKKRYDKEMEQLKAEAKKLRNQKRTDAKMDKLEAKRKEVEELKKSVKDKKSSNDDNVQETLEEKRATLLKSTNAKELYKNKDILTDAELNARINRIDLEARLASRIVEEPKKTGMDYVNKAISTYKKVDEVYSTVSNSAIGKTLAKKLGLEPPKKEFDLDDFWANRNKKSAKEIQEVSQRLANENRIKQEMDKRKKAENENSDKKSKTKTEEKTKTKTDKTETYTGTVEGEGTSRFKGWKDGPEVNAERGKDYWDVNDDIRNTNTSDIPNSTKTAGENFIAGLLEDKS